jgi:xanthine dehydrogenase accessory factor
MRLDLLKALNAARASRRAAVLVSDLTGGEQRLVREADFKSDALGDAIVSQVRTGKSGVVETDKGRFFLELHLPPPRLVATGAVHISQALAPMARIAGFDVTIIDPRTAFATAERFPDVRLIAEWPDVALARVGIDAFTGLIALTHDPKIDDQPLEAALRAECFYIGALGSRKTHGKRLERLRAVGLDDMTLSRIHAPIGMAIGARSPAEIAVAVLAQVIEALRSRGKDAREAAA